MDEFEFKVLMMTITSVVFKVSPIKGFIYMPETAQR